MGFLRFAQEDTACPEWIQANGAQVCLSVRGQWTLPRPPITTIIAIQIATALRSLLQCQALYTCYLLLPHNKAASWVSHDLIYRRDPPTPRGLKKLASSTPVTQAGSRSPAPIALKPPTFARWPGTPSVGWSQGTGLRDK